MASDINHEIAQYISRINELPFDEQREILALVRRMEDGQNRIECQHNFMSFVKGVWPGFISGRHHQIMAKAFERIAKGELKRLIVCLPPRHTKSEFASYLLPAWFLGKYPEKKIIQASHTAELAVGFGRKVRNLFSQNEFQKIFPGVSLSTDSKAAGRWNTNKGGEYFAIGVGGRVTGKGADLFIIDDPHSEQDSFGAEGNTFESVYEWYTSGPRQRLQPNGAIACIMTRWHKKDLVGNLIRASIERENADQWEVIQFPAILPSGNPTWPQFWSLEELDRLKATLPVGKWVAQYQQDPTSDEGALIKREWWKLWEKDKLPECEFVIQSWDTAYSKSERADFSACTTWGVFYAPGDDGRRQANLILMHAYRGRIEFPDLKKKALELHHQWAPDSLIIEAKAAGAPLVFELRTMGVPVQEYTPVRGTRSNPNDKVTRVNAISDVFSSGFVWAPKTREAEEVIEEFAAFPLGENDDLVDSATMAVMRFRQGGFLRLPTDEEEEDEPKYRQRKDYY